jgi:hypothetical protein
MEMALHYARGSASAQSILVRRNVSSMAGMSHSSIMNRTSSSEKTVAETDSPPRLGRGAGADAELALSIIEESQLPVRARLFVLQELDLVPMCELINRRQQKMKIHLPTCNKKPSPVRGKAFLHTEIP